MICRSSLIILFEDPFWIGLYERHDDCGYTVCRIVFGAEPRDMEVYDFLLRRWHTLRFSPPLPEQAQAERYSNPKRVQRQIQKTLQQQGVSTKAQQALQQQREAGKLQRRAKSRAQREEEQARKFALRQEKRKEKHRGR